MYYSKEWSLSETPYYNAILSLKAMIAIPLHLMAMSIAQFECWNMQLQRYHYDDYGSFFLRTLRLCLTLCNKITKNLANVI